MFGQRCEFYEIGKKRKVNCNFSRNESHAARHIGEYSLYEYGRIVQFKREVREREKLVGKKEKLES